VIGQEFSPAGGEVIQHRNLASKLAHSLDDVGAEKTGTPGNENRPVNEFSNEIFVTFSAAQRGHPLVHGLRGGIWSPSPDGRPESICCEPHGKPTPSWYHDREGLLFNASTNPLRGSIKTLYPIS